MEVRLCFLNDTNRHFEWRKLAKKARRKRIRQTRAKTRQNEEESERKLREQSPGYQELLQKQHEQDEFQAQEEARLAAQADARWREIEAEAQKQWIELQKKLAEAREERARQNALIKLEWEREQQRLKLIKEQKEKEREEKERQQQLLQEQIDNFVENGGDTPEHLKVDLEINPNKPICPFFQKTSACRFRDSCSRNHVKPGVSRVLLLSNFYSHYSLEQGENEHGDSALEFENDETYRHFREFFFDVLPEMEQYGRVRQFKVCCNHEPHLRGNVYVEYSSTREAVKGFRCLNGRWYGGKQLNVEFCKIDSWKSAICGLYFRKRCPKGDSCNFLHVFRNPNNLFHNADRDEQRTPPLRSYESERRNWRWSESPERLPQDISECREFRQRSSEKTVKNGTKSKRKPSRNRSTRRSRSGSGEKSRRTSHSKSSRTSKRSNK